MSKSLALLRSRLGLGRVNNVDSVGTLSERAS